MLEQAKKDNPSLTFFIDLHRDAASYERTMLEIDGEKYAKIMFVVGLKHDNYAPNLELANKLNDKIKEFNSELSRGVMQKTIVERTVFIIKILILIQFLLKSEGNIII